ncbi:MAG: hypothetical protein ACI4SM_00105 [Candidatus Gastranaerophilaceae bacterium]
MLKDTLIKIDLNKNHARNRYKNMGYDVSNDIIYVNVNDLPKNSKEIINVVCDYCGREYTTTYQIYNMIINKSNPKCACSDCINIKKRETNILKFSTEYASQNEEIKLKVKNTVLNKYGVDNISKLAEIKNKKIETSISHFGVEYPMQNKDILNKQIQTNMTKYGCQYQVCRLDNKDERVANIRKSLFNNRSVISSKAQRYVCSLYNGILNYPFDKYNLDILLNDNIVIEYNGSGHNIPVKRHIMTEEDFNKKEEIRHRTLINNGFKVIYFDNLSDKLPDDNTLLEIKNYCLQYLQNHSTIRVNLDDYLKESC